MSRNCLLIFEKKKIQQFWSGMMFEMLPKFQRLPGGRNKFKRFLGFEQHLTVISYLANGEWENS